jgi:TM2 domain-containing membrane protein YozV
MKKTLLTLALFAVVGLFNANASELSTTTTTSEYVVNDANIDALFTTSTDVSFEVTNTLNLNAYNPSNQMLFEKAGGSSKSAIVAIVLDFFLGGLGVHRAYLGTETFTWIGYILTCGGIFGIVPFVDLIVLIVSDVDKYTDNSKFFMW